MHCKTYSYLPAQARQIREQVFVEEQGFEEEFDQTDQYCQHLLAFVDSNEQESPVRNITDFPEESEAVATSRFFASTPEGEPIKGDQGSGSKFYTIGRLAVIKEWRGKNVGASILAATETAIKLKGGQVAILHAQEQAKDFYLKQGYCATGKRDFDQDCPHIWMSKDLQNTPINTNHSK